MSEPTPVKDPMADLMVLGESEYAAGHLDAAFEAWEKAHASYLRQGDNLAAASAAAKIAMHLIIDTGLLAPVRGWVKRAQSLVEGLGPTTVHAWIGAARAYERLFSGEFEEARNWADVAVEVGDQVGEPAAAAIGRVARARSYIFEGDISSGLPMLEEAAVLTTSGIVDPFTTGLIYCEIVCAWQGLAMYDHAEQWTDAMERFSAREGIGSVKGRCRIHRAEILKLRGQCRHAEDEAITACEELRPYMRREFGWPLKELGAIRLRLGDLEGAEAAFLSAHEKGWDPQPGLALLRLAQGDAGSAAALIAHSIEHPVDVLSKELPPNNDLRNAPLLEAQVEIAIAAGDVDTAKHACAEIERIASSYGSQALIGASLIARGRVLLAEGASQDAVGVLREALARWTEIGAPYEVAEARLLLALAHRAESFEEGAVLEFRAASVAFAEVGADLKVREVERLIRPRSKSSDVVDRARIAGEMNLQGDHWTIGFEGSLSVLGDMKGLRYLSRLLDAPGREMHVMDLVSLEREGSPVPAMHAEAGLVITDGGDAGPVLDSQAKDQYRRRLSDIEADIEEAEAFGDTVRAERARAEREYILHELSAAVGLGGRDRKAVAASERARVAVTRAIRNALKRIREHDTDLHTHLDLAIKTGTFCCYSPDPRARVDWKILR